MRISVQPSAAGDGRTVEGELSMEYGKSREYSDREREAAQIREGHTYGPRHYN